MCAAAFSKYGGRDGRIGSVSFMFDHVGVITYQPGQGQLAKDAMLEVALEAGADKIRLTGEDGHEFISAIERLRRCA